MNVATSLYDVLCQVGDCTLISLLFLTDIRQHQYYHHRKRKVPRSDPNHQFSKSSPDLFTVIKHEINVLDVFVTKTAVS